MRSIDNDDDDGIGFSLIMKDLLADLAVDEDDANNAANNWLSLDLLEQELKQLESHNSIMNYSNLLDDPQQQPQQQQYSTSAAGMVVHSQAAAALQQQQHVLQAFQSPMGMIPSVPPTSAASVSSMDYTGQYDTTNAMDAWSLSLQKFTASSLEADFLMADTARKQQNPPVTTTAVAPVTSDIQNFADYNVKETARVMVAPPPGITPDASQQLISQAAAKLVQQLQNTTDAGNEKEEESIKQEVTTETNEETLLVNQLTRNLQLIHENQVLHDVEEGEQDAEGYNDASTGLQTPPVKIPRPSPMTPQNSMTASTGSSSGTHQGSVIMSAPTPMPTPIVVKPLNAAVANVTNDTTDMVATTYPTTTMSQSLSPPVAAPQPQPPLHPPVMPVMAVPLPSTMAWQSPPPPMMMMMMSPPPPMPPQRPVFANPHPTATPIPATALSSKYMTARDIAFVVHGMLKPILMSENLGTMSTYHLQYWTRHHPVKPPMPSSIANRKGGIGSSEESKMDVASMQIQARHVKTKEWASDRKVLGSTGKTDVTRPRALIAISSSTIQTDTEESKNDIDGLISIKQQRAALWKSRIYCDQAYQCYTAVLDHRWQGPSSSTSVQPQLLKLTKCLGISVQTVLVDIATGNAITPSAGDTSTEEEGKQFRNQYSVDGNVLELLFKLSKGKILMARVLEDTLLPPSVVQVLLPVALPILFAAPTNTSDDDAAFADDRVLSAWTMVIDTLPMISSATLLETVKAIMKQPSKSILSTTDRMQCTHALLQRGASIAANDPTFASDWQETETQFMNIISSM